MVVNIDKVVKIAFQAAPWIYCAVLIRDIDKRRQQHQALYDMTKYILHVLEENDIELSEFDLIALKKMSEDG